MANKKVKKTNKQAVAAKKKKNVAEAAARKGSSPAKDKATNRKHLMEVAAVVFAVIMALSMMLPSLSGCTSKSSSSSATTDAATDAATDATSSTTAADTSTVSGVDSEYADTVAALENKLQGDPSNLATLINVANDYLQWGGSVTNVASTDDDKAHAADLYKKAMDYYDRYLALNDSKAARVNRALAQYYSGDTSGAISALEQFTAANTDYARGWAYLGMFYESQSQTDKAKDAFTKAGDADPDDTYGMRTYAEGQLSSISSSETGSTTSSTSSSSSSSSSTNLLNTLESKSGTSL